MLTCNTLDLKIMQLTFVEAEFDSKKKQTRRDCVPRKLQRLMPWAVIEAEIEPFYPGTNGKQGRPAIGLSRYCACISYISCSRYRVFWTRVLKKISWLTVRPSDCSWGLIRSAIRTCTRPARQTVSLWHESPYRNRCQQRSGTRTGHHSRQCSQCYLGPCFTA